MKKEGSGRRIAGNLIIILGLLCALGAGGLTLYNYLDGVRAEKAAADVMEKLADVIGDHLDEAYAQEEELDPYAEDPSAEDDSSDENGTGSSESSAEGAPVAASKRRGRTPQGNNRRNKIQKGSVSDEKESAADYPRGAACAAGGPASAQKICAERESCSHTGCRDCGPHAGTAAGAHP